MKHHTGGLSKTPTFELNKKELNIDVLDNKDSLKIILPGNMEVQVKKNKWKLEFYYNKNLLTTSDEESMSYITHQNDSAYIREQLSIDVGELLYGLGERFTPFVKNGQSVDIWNEDGGTVSEKAYKNIPFYVSNKGYGVFVNHPEKVSFEIASEKVSKSQFSVEGEELEYYIVAGDSLKEVIENYTSLTGKPSLPPAWSFGLWLSTSFTTDYDEATVVSFIDGMRERDIPLDVFHFDCFWMKEFEWCNFEWDERVFPDPVQMLNKLKEKDLKICLWINPYIAQKSPLFKQAKENGYLLKRPDGSVWQWDKWQAGLAIVDFTNPAACEWYKNKLIPLIEMGVDSFKTDFGERIPTDVVYHDGSDPIKMHNYYSLLYNKVVFELLEEHYGKNEAVVFARSGSVGSQKFPVHWGGDCWSNYASMAESLRGGLSLGLSGFSYWSHDIAGFEQNATPDLYKRWTQFGLLSSHSRYHGNVAYKVPWIFDEEAVDVTRYFTKLKCKLMPYLYQQAVYSSETGIPIMRPMVLEFPENETCHILDRQYMLGDSLLIAPIFNEKGVVKYYLPKGRWTNYITGKVVEEGWHKEVHSYMTLPLMVRENTLLATGSRDDKADYDYTENPILKLYELQDGCTASTVLVNEKGKYVGSIEVSRKQNEFLVVTKDFNRGWQLLLNDIHGIIDNHEFKFLKTEQGILIDVKSKTITIHLSNKGE